MALELSEAREKIKAPSKLGLVQRAVAHEERLRFHTESYMLPGEVGRSATIFLDWVKTLIPKDKYKTFVSLFQFPTANVALVDSIYTELERVFDGRNPNFDYRFTDAELRADWEIYREDQLKEPQIWRRKGWQSVKTAINSVLIVDLPEGEATGLAEPYFYWLDINNVLDFCYKDDVLEYIIFKQPDNKIAVFDDETYRVFKINDKKEITEELVNQEHGLGYCPARFFWSDELNQRTPELKSAPISSFLASLDWLLFFSVSKKHLDLYAPYPIYSAYEADCDFANSETGDYCDGGYLRNDGGDYKILRDNTLLTCPKCSEKHLAGPGSFIDVPIPKGEDPDLRNPVQITAIDEASLNYNVDEVSRLKAEVFNGVVGTGGDVTTKAAVNEMQVTGNFESKVSVLNKIKVNLEAAQKFVDDTVCRLRYGDFFLGSYISMGTEFYIYSIDTLYKQYAQAKTNGASESELDAINGQILATEHRNNPAMLQRMLILRQLEPYRHYTLDELMTLDGKNLLDKDLLKIKINFNTFVERFERENTNLREFGMQLDLDKKLNIITAKFKDYVREQKPGEPGEPGE